MRGIVLVSIAVIAMILSAIFKKDQKTKYDGKIVSSQMLSEEVAKERGNKKLPQVNSVNGSTNTYARMDKSWSSFPDFVGKLIKGWRRL